MMRGMAQVSYLLLTLPARETCSRPGSYTIHHGEVVEELLGVTRFLPNEFFQMQ